MNIPFGESCPEPGTDIERTQDIAEMCGNVIAGVRSALGSDFVDMYHVDYHRGKEIRSKRSNNNHALVKAVFMKMAFDDGADNPPYQMVIEETFHGATPQEIVDGLGEEEKNFPFYAMDKVRVTLLDNAEKNMSSWNFGYIGDEADENLIPHFHRYTAGFIAGPPEYKNIIEVAHNIDYRFLEYGVSGNPLSMYDELIVIQNMLQKGQLDKRAADSFRTEAIRNEAAGEGFYYWLNERPDIVRATVPFFNKFADIALDMPAARDTLVEKFEI